MYWLKYFFITLIIVVDFLVFTNPVSTSDLDKSILLPVLKIAIVNSYDIDHVCGSPQTQGIIHGLSKLDSKYQLDIQVWYMKTDITFTTPDKIEYIAKKVIDDIKAFNPDHIFTVDDTAFKNVGIPFSKTHKVFFSGLNKPFNEYLVSEDMDGLQFCGIEEYLALDKIFKMISKIEFYPYKFWILTDTNTTSFYLAQNYKKEIKKHSSFLSEIITISKTSELRSTLSSLQKEKKGVIIYAFQTLANDDYNIVKTKKSLLPDLLKYNKKHLELCENCYYSKKGISLVLSPDFYKMGSDVSAMFVSYIENNIFQSVILKSSNLFLINIKRLDDLAFKWVYNKIIEEVDGSYAIY